MARNGQPGELGLEQYGFRNLKQIHWNLPAAGLYEHAVRNGEGKVAVDGPFVAITGQHTGRSPKDKFFVREPSSEANIWWESNQAMEPVKFDALLESMLAYARDKELYVQDLFGGADATYRLPVRVINEFAWHSLFIQHMLIEPKAHERRHFHPEFTIIDLPGFSADPKIHGCRTSTVIAIHLARKLVLIGGTSYAGEMKKSVFTLLNYFLPGKRVMSMHASANMSKDSSAETALFFGLSGTGKTTLSADPHRILIGDDEHGWSENGIFNIEGGCYAKMIRLSADAEPEIYSTAHRFGTVLENVVMDDETRELDLDSDKYTENTRSAYPLSYIPNTSPTGVGKHPKNLILLTADAFGVMPPIAKLTPSQAMYHFLSGFTAKVAGTEKGLGADPEPTFSTCFGAPFLPRHPSEYGNLLRDLIAQHKTDCWLVNTGWTGGKYGVGRRMPIKVTRALLAAALDGSLADAEMRIDPHFHFRVPVAVPGIESTILNPRNTWADKEAYDQMARKLARMFRDNFKKFEKHVGDDVLSAAPGLAEAAE
ncbi:MAG TPA: phosphoenolpyruvate carboxykinase [Micropepsaceae bacterium]|nr:phosphoenolpyruvate carboxykinase [Micropepsaceae bacterium]